MTVADLSNPAQAILAATFMSDATELTMENEQSILSTQARAAISELIATGYVEAKKADDSLAMSITYSLTAKGKNANRKKSIAWITEHAAFPLTQPLRA